MSSNGISYTPLKQFSAEGRSIISGPFGSSISSKFFVDSGVPVIRGNNLNKDKGYFYDDDFVYITQDKADELNAYAEVDDIVLTAAGTIGQVGIISNTNKYNKYTISNKQIRVRLDTEKVSPLFIYYVLSSKQMVKYIEGQNTGSTIPLINLGIVKRLPIPTFNKSTQEKIAKILADLDRKIELNQRINVTLEQIGQTLFKHYFIHNPESESWKEGSITEVFNVAYGKNLPTSKLLPKGYPVFGGNGQIGFYDKYLYEGKQVLVSCRGNGSGVVNITKRQSFVTNNSLVIEIPIESFFTFEYLKYFAITRNNSFFEYVTGSAQPQITIDSISKCKLKLPPKNLVLEFTDYVSSFEQMIDSLQEQIETLNQTRDLLLPRLISGKIEI